MGRLSRLLVALGLNEVRCAACGAPFASDKDDPCLCPDCRSRMDAPAAGCPRCGLPLVGTGNGLCGECLADPPPWVGFRMIGLYRGLLRELVLRGKFGGEAAVLAVLGEVLALRCRDLGQLRAVVPVPLHPRRLRERGFNQCLELARSLARSLGVPLEPALLERRVSGHPQRGLTRAARLANLERAFVASPRVAGCRVLLVDDIMTTGATLRRASQCLRQAGASVDAAVVARTPAP